MTATRTAARPARVRQAAPPRPRLRLVPSDELTPLARQRRSRRVAFGVGVLICLALLGVVASHVVLTQNQFRIEQLNRKADALQGRYDQLRLEVARLESPERIVATAQESLGMVTPEEVKYLTPRAEESPPPVATVARDGDVPAEARAATAGMASGWTVVKPHLTTAP